MTAPSGPPILTHRIPVPLPLRWILGVLALAVIMLPTWELFRGIWPPNIASPVFLIIILGALSIGVPLLTGAATGPSVLWKAEPGVLRLVQKRPLRRAERDVFHAADIATLETRECEHMEGDSTWIVVLTVTDGRSFTTQSFPHKAGADDFRLRLAELLVAGPPKQSGARTADP